MVPDMIPGMSNPIPIQRGFRMSPELFSEFKAKLKTEGKQMNEIVIGLIGGYVRRGTISVDPAVRSLDQRPADIRRPSLDQQARTLASTVAEILRNDADWARQAILKADLGPPGSWAFGERISHFSDEKDHIAEHFGQWLLKRILYHLDQIEESSSPEEHSASGTKVILFLDSGTTMAAFFRRFVKLLDSEPRAKDVVMVTNNIPAVESYLNACRTSMENAGDKPSVDDRVTCILLPGKALPEYGAVTGKFTTDMLEMLRNQHPAAVTIGLTTGNWLHLSDTPPVWPIPLARGEGHREFKEKLIQHSKEVYLLSPLGKLFANVSADRVNSAWGFTSDNPNPRRRTYGAVSVAEEKRSSIRVVSTSRSATQVLYKHSALIDALLRPSDVSAWQESVGKDFGNVPHVLLPFTKFESETLERQIEIDVPHDYARQESFMAEFLSIRGR